MNTNIEIVVTRPTADAVPEAAEASQKRRREFARELIVWSNGQYGRNGLGVTTEVWVNKARNRYEGDEDGVHCRVHFDRKGKWIAVTPIGELGAAIEEEAELLVAVALAKLRRGPSANTVATAVMESLEQIPGVVFEGDFDTLPTNTSY
ncbi:MAG: hypothetical protein JWM49_632 [Microbacteriaceae bacterium]|nr:hypothetical protein [Microbacteriaceae bacterium]